MEKFVDYFNFLNSFFGLSVYSYNTNKKCYVKSYFKIIYSITILVLTFLIFPRIIEILSDNVSEMSGNQLLSKLVCIFQTLFQLFLNIVLMFYKLLYCNKNILNLNHYTMFKSMFNIKLNNGVVRKLNKYNDGRYIFILSSVILFFVQLVTNIIVMSAIINYRIDKYPYIAFYIFTYFQLISAGNIFYENILQYKFMISCVNQTLSDYLEIYRYALKYRSKARSILVSCNVSDDLNVMQKLNSEIYFSIRQMIECESFTMSVVFLHNFLEIIVSLFYQFIGQVVYVDGFNNERKLLEIFGISYITCNIIAVLLYIAVCERMQEEMSTTAKILHEFPVHKTDDRLKESINRFSLQILQEKRPISVCGMFNVDNTLLYSMISSMTSYLILLVQFQLQGVGSSKG
uniref:Gustatory receptor n=1 Tax=Phlebotomus papatasi TaxID=29031 RepID=A0A3F2ZEQ1_PHLPP